jgi:hypothetical protein
MVTRTNRHQFRPGGRRDIIRFSSICSGIGGACRLDPRDDLAFGESFGIMP